MKKLLQNKKLVILCAAIAVVIAVGAGVLVWCLTSGGGSDPADSGTDTADSGTTAADDGTDTENKDTYTVSFVTNGGKEIESMKVEKGTVLSQADLPVPSKRGELFLSWNKDAALTEPYWEEAVDGDMTLYASYVKTSDDVTENELVNSIIPFAETDFSVTVCSSAELTNDNIAKYIMLTVYYGEHKNGDAIRLSVAPEGDGVYRISGNFAAGGEYLISLMSDEVTFNPEDEMLLDYGLTDALRTLRFRILGESFIDGELSDKVADIPSDKVEVKDGNSIKVLGADQKLIGLSPEDNGVICIGDGDDISDYYKVIKIESTSADGITYTVRPAEVEEVYDRVTGYEWIDMDSEGILVNEEVEASVMESLANNEQLNNYVKYLALAATQTSTYKEMSMEEFGEIVAMPMTTIVTPAKITTGLDMEAYNGNFVQYIGEDSSEKFVKFTLGVEYAVKLAKVGSKGAITAQIKLQVDFWIWIGVGGYIEIGWGEYDIDCGSTTLTQTEITFSISVVSENSKKSVNVNDEIEAIYNSAKEPTPENLLEQYNELMSGGSKPIELFNEDIFRLPILSLLYGAVEIAVPVRFVVTLDVEATFTSYVTVLTGNDFGIKGNEDTGLDAVSTGINERYIYRLELRGRIELRAGMEMGLELSLGYGLASVSLNVQLGFYGELYGYFFYEREKMNWRTDSADNMGGAWYFEFGAYLDINLRAKVCSIKYKGTLKDMKWEICSAGQKEILYGFANPTADIVEMDGKYVYIDDTGILDVYIYDITKERDENNPRLVEDYPFDRNKFNFSFSNGDFYIGDDTIVVTNLNNGVAFEATLAISYKGGQLTFRDTLTKYVTVRYSRVGDVDWDNIDKTCKVDFTVDGEVVFTREVPFGSTLTMRKYLYYEKTPDGFVSCNLTNSERKTVYDAGYERVYWFTWPTEPGFIFVTEDMTIEADSNTKRRPWKITLTDNSGTTVIEANHGDEINIPFPSEGLYTTTEHIYEFAGWKDKNGKIYSSHDLHKITSDLTLRAQYKASPRKYSVIFDGNGGTLGNGSETFEMIFEYGKMPEYPFTPVRETTATARYEFVGWSPEIKRVTGDVTYKAQWKEIKRYTVTFDASDGQFDENGKRTYTITVDDGYALTANDFPTDPYKKTTGGYYEFDAWVAPVSVGTKITGNVTYEATYKNDLVRTTGIWISDGVNAEDIAAFLDGTNKVKGYTYTLNTEYYGNYLEITAPGLSISGEASDICIGIINTDVTLRDLRLEQSNRAEIIGARGKVTVNIAGIVELTNNTDAEAIRGDAHGEYGTDGAYTHYADADITLRGVNNNAELRVNVQGYGIAVYGALTIDDLPVELAGPETVYKDPETGWTYDAIVLQVHNHPRGVLTVKDSDITVYSGVVNAAWLYMTNSEMEFRGKMELPGYSHGLHIMNYHEMTTPETLIKLEKSHIIFRDGITVSVEASLADGETFYYINTSEEKSGFLRSYKSWGAFMNDAEAYGYSGMVSIDESSGIYLLP